MIGAIHGMLGVTSVRFYDQLSSCAVPLGISAVSLHYMILSLDPNYMKSKEQLQSQNKNINVSLTSRFKNTSIVKLVQ